MAIEHKGISCPAGSLIYKAEELSSVYTTPDFQERLDNSLANHFCQAECLLHCQAQLNDKRRRKVAIAVLAKIIEEDKNGLNNKELPTKNF